MNSRFRTFVRAALFEDRQLGLGQPLHVEVVAKTAKMNFEEALTHSATMVKEGLAQMEGKNLKLDYDRIRFAGY